MARWVALIVWLTASTALATSYAPPKKQDIPSADGKFVLHVDPGSATQVVADARDPATPLWSLPHDVGFTSFYLANDGLTVAVVSWEFVKVEELDTAAVELWSAGGKIKTYSHRDLITRPPRIRGVGPMGSFWRQWRTDASLDGDTLVVSTTGPFAYAFDMRTGAIADRRLSGAHVMLWAIGLAMLALAVTCALSTRRAMRRADSVLERRRLVIAMIAPVCIFVWLWLDLSGIPLLRAEIVDDLQLGVSVVGLIAAPVSLITSALLPTGSRSVRLALNVFLLVGLISFRIVW
jgi:hypothetical protein